MADLQKTPFVSTGILRTFSGIPQWLNNWGNSWTLNLESTPLILYQFAKLLVGAYVLSLFIKKKGIPRLMDTPLGML